MQAQISRPDTPQLAARKNRSLVPPVEPHARPTLPLRPIEDPARRIIRRHLGGRRFSPMRRTPIAADMRDTEVAVPVVRMIQIELLIRPDRQTATRTHRDTPPNQPLRDRPLTLMIRPIPGRARLQQPQRRLRTLPTDRRAIPVLARPRHEAARAHRASTLSHRSPADRGGMGQTRGHLAFRWTYGDPPGLLRGHRCDHASMGE